MQYNFLYLIGIPGSGKTTLVKSLISSDYKTILKPHKHLKYNDNSCQLGVINYPFSGSDTLPMNCQKRIIEWLKTTPYKNVLCEGDRLANKNFFNIVQQIGYNIDIVCLDTPLNICAENRQNRGTKQSEVWLKGRITKVNNLKPFCSVVESEFETLRFALKEHVVIRNINGFS